MERAMKYSKGIFRERGAGTPACSKFLMAYLDCAAGTAMLLIKLKLLFDASACVEKMYVCLPLSTVVQ